MVVKNLNVWYYHIFIIANVVYNKIELVYTFVVFNILLRNEIAKVLNNGVVCMNKKVLSILQVIVAIGTLVIAVDKVVTLFFSKD